jgi:hypothetical protein
VTRRYFPIPNEYMFFSFLNFGLYTFSFEFRYIPRGSNPISRSDRFQSNPRRISSETDIFHKKPIGSDMVFVGFRGGGSPMKSGSDLVGFHRVPSNSDEIRAGFRPIGIRQKPCRSRQRLFRSDRIRPPMNLLGF